MPTTRWYVKRDLDQCVIHTQRIQHYLTRGGRLYEPEHPKQYQLFCLLVAFTAQLETGLKELRGHL